VNFRYELNSTRCAFVGFGKQGKCDQKMKLKMKLKKWNQVYLNEYKFKKKSNR
jgi:hypothetical protein